MEQDKTDLALLTYLVERFVVLLRSSGICARIGYGTVRFEFKISDKNVTYATHFTEKGMQVKPE